MRLFAFAAVLSLAFLLTPARAQEGPDDQYVVIYGMIQQADNLAANGQPREALGEFQAAQTELQKFAKANPEWNPRIINFRTSYLADRIAAVSALLPTAPATPSAGTAPAPTPAAAPAQPAANPDAALQAQIADLRAQLQNVQSANAELSAKLKEALTVQPAAADPRELAAAQEQVRSLMKENALLQVAIAQGKQSPAAAPADSGALEQARNDLAKLDKKLSEEVKIANQFSDRSKALEAQVKDLQSSHEGVQALKDENAVLKKQVAEARAEAKKAKAAAKLQAELDQAHTEMDSLKEALRASTLEKEALEDQVKKLQLAAAKGGDQGDTETRIQKLEKERDDLRMQLAAAKSKPSRKSRAELDVQIEKLSDQVRTLEDRLTVDEAHPIPYTPEELALFRQSPPTLSPATVAETPAAETPGTESLPSTAELTASARSHFAAGEYDQAAGDYQKLLQQDKNNGQALADLATIDLQQGHLDDAEKHIQAALALSPDNAHNLAVLGNIRFQQQKFDDALDVLSRAAKIDPENPEVQNYLGITLAQKGQRLQAETALRKALLLDANYAPAHNNLAVVYISENPPRAELARWHYLKAIAAGQPHNPGLEKLLSDNGAPVSSP